MEEQKNYRKIIVMKILRIAAFILVIVAFIIIYPTLLDEDESFLIFTTDCDKFTILGNMAYNEFESKIYLSRIELCGGNHPTKYKYLDAYLYQTNINLDVQRIQNDEGMDLIEFLSEVRFNVENFSEICPKGSNWLIHILATNFEYQTTSHLIELRLTITCPEL